MKKKKIVLVICCCFKWNEYTYIHLHSSLFACGAERLLSDRPSVALSSYTRSRTQMRENRNRIKMTTTAIMMMMYVMCEAASSRFSRNLKLEKNFRCENCSGIERVANNRVVQQKCFGLPQANSRSQSFYYRGRAERITIDWCEWVSEREREHRIRTSGQKQQQKLLFEECVSGCVRVSLYVCVCAMYVEYTSTSNVHISIRSDTLQIHAYTKSIHISQLM